MPSSMMTIRSEHCAAAGLSVPWANRTSTTSENIEVGRRIQRNVKRTPTTNSRQEEVVVSLARPESAFSSMARFAHLQACLHSPMSHQPGHGVYRRVTEGQGPINNLKQ